MKRLSFIFALVILLAGGAIGAMPAPSYAQGGYGGYNYPPPPQNSYATPWVGSNTPWTFYQGDWFLKGILHQFFGNQYGWAPYYAYPPTYIVRPNNWYEPKWNAWYQRNPHYWQSFEQKYPYWRGHRVGQRYDQNFYNTHHRGQGGGWNQGYHGVRPPGTPPGHDIRRGTPPGHDIRRGPDPGHDDRSRWTPPGRGVRDPRAYGDPGVKPSGVPGRGVRDPRATGPVGPTPKASGPAVHGPIGSGGPPPKATGHAGSAPASGTGGSKPGKTPAAEKKHQE